MPVLIILLFYIHDLSKLKRYYDQTEFVGQQMVNILQNIAKTRTVTQLDIKYAASLAYLTVYPGTTMYSTSGDLHHIFNHQPRVYVSYVEGESDGKASIKWTYWTRSGAGETPDTWNAGFLAAGNTDQSAISNKINANSSEIYPTLKTEETKPKVLIDVQLRRENRPEKETFGFYFVNPKYVGNNQTGYFSSVMIFSPNNGFSSTRPAAK
jgi:hypothetical protein